MERIGKYRILQKLGDGATSSVYLAFDEFRQRQVALKVLADHGFATEKNIRHNRRMYDIEASLTGRLNHPNIVNILDAERSDTVSYIAMDPFSTSPSSATSTAI